MPNYASINAARERQRSNETDALIQAESRAANEIQAQTGCTRTEALFAAKRAFEHCAVLGNIRKGVPSVQVTIGRHGPHEEIRCVTDPHFSELWSDKTQILERVDELNRGLTFPAYFVA